MAYADLVARAFLHIRNRASRSDEELHDLADALHNISGILGEYGAWIDDAGYRSQYLKPYDARWGSAGLSLEAFLDERIAHHTKWRRANKSPDTTRGK
jgi:hypothetical protein